MDVCIVLFRVLRVFLACLSLQVCEVLTLCLYFRFAQQKHDACSGPDR